MSKTLPVQWFNSKLGTANGLVKLGGGLGATTMAIVIQALIDKVGIPWTFRIFGFVSLITGIPAALLVRERIFLAGAVGTFAFFVPPFFLPLFAHSIGLSASTGSRHSCSFQCLHGNWTFCSRICLRQIRLH